MTLWYQFVCVIACVFAILPVIEDQWEEMGWEVLIFGLSSSMLFPLNSMNNKSRVPLEIVVSTQVKRSCGVAISFAVRT